MVRRTSPRHWYISTKLTDLQQLQVQLPVLAERQDSDGPVLILL